MTENPDRGPIFDTCDNLADSRPLASSRLDVCRPQSDGISDRSLSSLLRLDVCCSDHLAPLCGFVSDEFTEVGGRLGERCGSQVGQARLDVGIRKTRIDIRVQLVDDLGRCISGY